MSGRAATTDVIPGKYALAVGIPDKKLAPGWTWRRLTDVAEMATGHTPSRNHPNYWDGEIAWIGIKDAREFHGRRITTTFQTVTQAGIDNSASVLLPANTVCLSRTASVGYVTIMDRPMATSQDFVNWKCSDALVPEFLMYLLIAERDSLFKFGKGTTHTTIYFPEAKALCAGLPPPGEQRRIVAKIEELFSDLDAGVAALKRVRANLKRYRAAVLKAAVEGRLTEEWRRRNPSTEPAAKLLERILAERRAMWEQDQLRKFKEAGKTPPKGWKERYEEPASPAPLGDMEVPRAWTVASLEQLTSGVRVICYGILMPKDHVPDGIPYVKVRDMRGDRLDPAKLQRTSPAIAAQYARASLRPGDLLLAIRGTYGRAVEVPSELDGGNITQDTARLDVSAQMDHQFVLRHLRSMDTQNYFKRVARGVAVKGVNIGDVRPTPILVPPMAEQAEIVAEVDSRLSVADAAETQVEHALQRATRLRQAILKRAFEGKLVPQDPTDEPAAALLERIKRSSNGKHPAQPNPPMRRSRARA